MPQTTSAPDAVASGKVISAGEGLVVFKPAGTNYQLHLLTPRYDGPLNKPVKCTIRATARKVYTVPSGGSFITPIIGPPRIVQGRVLAADRQSLLVQAGCPLHLELPPADDAIDLDEGPIAVGKMVNVVCFPGARAEFVQP